MSSECPWAELTNESFLKRSSPSSSAKLYRSETIRVHLQFTEPSLRDLWGMFQQQ
jgi:hypothetical protein